MPRRLRKTIEATILLALTGVAVMATVQVLFSSPSKGTGSARRGADFDTPTTAAKKKPPNGVGERVPDGAVARLGTLRWRLGNWCSHLEYSPDASRLMSVEARSTVRVWDCATGEQVCRTVPVDENYSGAPAMAPDHSRFAVGGDDGTVFLFDGQSGRLARKFAGHQESSVRLLRRAARERFGLPELTDRGWAGQVQFSPDSRTLYSVGGDGFLRAWEVDGGRQRWGVRGHSGGIRALAVSPDGEHIATGGFDGRVRLWNAATGERVRQVDHYQTDDIQLAFGPTGDELYILIPKDSGSRLDVFHLNSRLLSEFPLLEFQQQRGQEAPNANILWMSSDGQRTVFFDGNGLRVADMSSRATTALDGPMSPMRYPLALASAPGERVAFVRRDRNQLQALPPGGDEDRSKDHCAAISAIVADPSGQRLATADNSGVLRIWDRQKWSSQVSLELGPNQFPVRFTQDGAAVAVGLLGWHGDPKVWPHETRPAEQWRFLDAATGQPRFPWCDTLPEAESWWCVHGSFDGRLWVLAREDAAAEAVPATIHLAGYDALEGQVAWEWPAPFTQLTAVHLTLNGTRVAASGLSVAETPSRQDLVAMFDAVHQVECWRLSLGEQRQSLGGVTRGNRFLSVGSTQPGQDRLPVTMARFLNVVTGVETLQLQDMLFPLPLGRWSDGEDKRFFLPFVTELRGDKPVYEMRVYDSESGDVVRRIPVPPVYVPTSAFISRDGRRAAFEFKSRHNERQHRWSAWLIDIDSGRTLWHSEAENQQPYHFWIDLIDDDRELIAGAGDGPLLRVDVASGETLPTLEHVGGQITKCVVSFDRQLLITGANDGWVGVWRRSDGRRLKDFHGHRGPISLLSILPDGKHFATGSQDSTVVIWPLETVHSSH